jgi:heterodisulfide reductase subunit A2
MNTFDSIIIGAGPAGLKAADTLANFNRKVLLIDTDAKIGGKLNLWDRLFPDFSSSQELLNQLSKNINNENVTLKLNTNIISIKNNDNHWMATDSNGNTFYATTMIIATGFDVFDAHRKEEYGYGIYKNVITSVDLEKILSGEVSIETPSKVAFIQCVGSRDEKVGNNFCSKNCCICAVKQTIELKEKFSLTDIYCFYMDLRMFGQSYEELYRRSQQDYGVNFVRGRVSEISPTMDNKVVLKAEDTLLSRPLKLTADLVVLMVGMEASKGTKILGNQLNINNTDGFVKSTDRYLSDSETTLKGLFVTGTSKRQMSIPETMNDAVNAAVIVNNFLNTL